MAEVEVVPHTGKLKVELNRDELAKGVVTVVTPRGFDLIMVRVRVRVMYGYG